MNTDVTDPEITNFDWFDMSLFGELTDKQKWKMICLDEAIHLPPTPLPIKVKVILLKRYLYAFSLSEGDFTVEGMLKK